MVMAPSQPLRAGRIARSAGNLKKLMLNFAQSEASREESGRTLSGSPGTLRSGAHCGSPGTLSLGHPKFGAELVGEVAQYEDKYRLCYMRGPTGIIVALAEELF